MESLQGSRVRNIVPHRITTKPLTQSGEERLVGEVFTPQSGVSDPGFGEAAVEIQHAYQAGPLAAPIGHREDGPTMTGEPRQHMMTVLPHCFAHHQGSVRRNVAKDLVAALLAVDETMAARLLVGVGPLDLVA